ncbi:two-component response regulator ORR24-like [Nymphaea colorata]|uniref:two-component response regulator ORR24-like n=1 Tax=Nymphaea colorata TaxID=210225 RepID=UPI00129DA3F6|nr:two-component response regulator ORR24-like [Nymphaea colorata]
MTVVRVLLVDDDPSSLKLLEKMLQHCEYDVTATSSPATAMQMLKDQSQGSYDIFVGDARMMQMEGSELFDVANGEMDLPVVLISATADTEAITKAVLSGAKDFLIKPIRLEEIKNIWLHVERKKAFEFVERSPTNDVGEEGIECVNEDEDEEEEEDDDVDHGKSVMAASESNASEEESSYEQMEMETDNGDSNEGSLSRRKRRVVWTNELHGKFIEAMNMINPQMLSKKSLTNASSGAVPRLILRAMNVPGLTLQNVASHLQKYRLNSKREQEARIAATVSMQNQDLTDRHSELAYSAGSMVNQAPQPSTTGPLLSTSKDHLLTNKFNGRGLTGFRGHSYYTTGGSIPRFRRQLSLPGRVSGSSNMPLHSVPTGYQHQFSTWNSSSYMPSRGWSTAPSRAPCFNARVDHLRNNFLPQGNALGRGSTDNLTTMGNFSSGLMCDTTPPFQANTSALGNFSSGLTCDTTPPFPANTSDMGTTAEALQRGPVIGGNLPTPSFTEGSFQPMSYHSNNGAEDLQNSAGRSRWSW